MPNTVIISTIPGKELFYCGGTILQISDRTLLSKHYPFIIYTCISDIEIKNSYYSKKYQINNIYSAASLLKFNWEFIYTGRKYFGKLKKTIKIDEMIEQISKRLLFLSPINILLPFSTDPDSFYLNNKKFYDFLMDKKYNIFLYGSRINNFNICLNNKEVSNKIEACKNFNYLNNNSYIFNNIEKFYCINYYGRL